MGATDLLGERRRQWQRHPKGKSDILPNGGYRLFLFSKPAVDVFGHEGIVVEVGVFAVHALDFLALFVTYFIHRCYRFV